MSPIVILEEKSMRRRIPAAPRATRRFALAFVAAFAIIVAPPLLAQTEIKLGHVGEPGSLFQKSADEFAKRANAKKRV